MSARFNQPCESQSTNLKREPYRPSFTANHVFSVPPNVSFEISDLTQTWTFTHKFDFIFSRMMTGAFGDWPSIIQQYYE